ncbi:hypothetical protein MRO55_25990, partial [Escherichia coli]|uniref:hypothetical protein n=1 Tax=Escherichia coli TaxID=562 RepID=UPI00211393A8
AIFAGDASIFPTRAASINQDASPHALAGNYFGRGSMSPSTAAHTRRGLQPAPWASSPGSIEQRYPLLIDADPSPAASNEGDP